MFRIRQEQMQAFAEQRVSAFVERMVQRLKSDFSNEVAQQKLEEKELEPLVRKGIKEAEAYGAVGENDLELYIDCMVLFSPDFDRNPRFPWAGEILNQAGLNGTEKMDRIHDYLVFATDKGR
jgi:hypothetical protein